MKTSHCLATQVVVAVVLATALIGEASACDFVLGGPSPFPTGPTVCKPGFLPPQCTAVPYDTTLNLAFSGNG